MRNKLLRQFGMLCIILMAVCVIGPIAFGCYRGAGYVLDSFSDPEVLFALKTSLWTSAVSTLLCMVITVSGTVALYYRNPAGRFVLKSVMSSTLSLPHIVTGVLLLLFFGQQGIGRWLRPVGLDFIFTVRGILLCQTVINIPFTVEQIWTALDRLDDKLLFTARMLGADEWKTVFRVIVPMIRGDLLVCLIICFSRALGEYLSLIHISEPTRPLF